LAWRSRRRDMESWRFLRITLRRSGCNVVVGHGCFESCLLLLRVHRCLVVSRGSNQLRSLAWLRLPLVRGLRLSKVPLPSREILYASTRRGGKHDRPPLYPQLSLQHNTTRFLAPTCVRPQPWQNKRLLRVLSGTRSLRDAAVSQLTPPQNHLRTERLFCGKPSAAMCADQDDGSQRG
jgi:hypothetical protein